MSMQDKILKLFGITQSKTIRNIKGALKLAQAARDPDDKVAAVVQDYPVLVDFAKAYIKHEDWESAEEIIRVCFKLRDEYADWGGRREVFLVRKLTKAFINAGRDDIAQKIILKVKNFEQGVPHHALSTAVISEEMLAAAREELGVGAQVQDPQAHPTEDETDSGEDNQ